MKPMLAFRTKPSKLEFPLFIQRKYNGLRGLWLPESQTLQSRDEILYERDVIKHLLTELTSLRFAVDGEIYAHGMSLQDINSRMAINRKSAHQDACSVGYVIYDIPSTEPMWKRVEYLRKAEGYMRNKFGTENRFVSFAETIEIFTQAEADYYYARFKEEKYEGAMYRMSNAPYGFSSQCGNKENRWWHLQKRKGTEDLTATIVGFNELISAERGPDNTLGSFQCSYTHPDGAVVYFDAGSGLDHYQRERYWNDPNCVLGQLVDIEFEMFSDTRVPLKPIVSCVYEAY